MSKLSKKAILSVLTLVLTFVALGATTFAWFTLGTTATVDQFNVEVRGSEGLEISLDETNWYTRLNSGMMNDHISSTFTGGKLDAVTTNDALLEFQKFNGMNGREVLLTAAEANKDYLEFKLHFRTKVSGQKLQLTAMTLASTGLPWTPDVPYTFENGNPVDSEAEDLKVFPHYGARVSLNDKIFQADEEDNNLGFDLEKGAHNYLAVKNGLYVIDNPGTLPTYVDEATQVGTVTSTNSIEVIGEFVEPESGEEFHTGTVKVRVWLEGWDANTYDAIFDGKLQIGFEFELVAAQ